MLTSEERLIGKRESWFNVPICEGGMLKAGQQREKNIENEGCIPVHEYLDVEVKEEVECNKKYWKESSDAENETPHCPPLPPQHPNGLIVPEFIKVEVNEPEDSLELEKRGYLGTEAEMSDMINGQVPKDANFEKYQKFQAERIKQIYSLLYPRYLQNMGPNLDLHYHHQNSTQNPTPVVQQIKKGKRNQRLQKNSLLSLRFQLSPWETERILRRREQNRKRKALQRAQETEEQRNLRREKERLAKAALRAMEPLEKRMIRRERDRIAKAMSRAAETEEQRRVRREKNRIAMAALRAAQTEEERFIRREKDRIKKATIRALETEEQKRIRREKNRIAMATRRANLNEQERTYLRNVSRLAKVAYRSYLTAEQRALMMEAKLTRRERMRPGTDPLEIPSFNELCSEQKCLGDASVFEQETDEEVECSSEADENLERKENGEMYLRNGSDSWGMGIPAKVLGSPSTSNQSTFISGPSTHNHC